MNEIVPSNLRLAITTWMQTQWERVPAVPHSQPGSYARGYDGGMVDILRGLQATLDKCKADETPAPQNMHSDEWWQAELDRCVRSEQDKYRALFDAYRELKAGDPEVTAGCGGLNGKPNEDKT